MNYKKIVKAKFISRPNRFIANVSINGKEEIVHVKNTGRCRELLIPGCTVFLDDYEGRMGTRKLRYSLVAVLKGNLLINMDSQAPNMVIKEALSDGRITIPGMGNLSVIKPEFSYGDSRFDFYVEDKNGKKGFIEVKGCTLEEDGIASFPDAPTERGVKHIKELIKAHKEGYIASIIFAIQMEGMKYITPNDATHPEFGKALREAKNKGVNVLAFECAVTPQSLEITKPVEVVL